MYRPGYNYSVETSTEPFINKHKLYVFESFNRFKVVPNIVNKSVCQVLDDIGLNGEFLRSLDLDIFDIFSHLKVNDFMLIEPHSEENLFNHIVKINFLLQNYLVDVLIDENCLSILGKYFKTFNIRECLGFPNLNFISREDEIIEVDISNQDDSFNCSNLLFRCYMGSQLAFDLKLDPIYDNENNR